MRFGSFFGRPMMWVWFVGLIASAFWLVGLGCGWRGLLLTDPGRGIVAKAQGFGDASSVWWVPASVLTGALVVLGVGISVVGALVDAPATSTAEGTRGVDDQETGPSASTVG